MCVPIDGPDVLGSRGLKNDGKVRDMEITVSEGTSPSYLKMVPSIITNCQEKVGIKGTPLSSRKWYLDCLTVEGGMVPLTGERS